MLSVVDLLEAGTLSLAQAAWLAARVAEGSSWLVGARPGGAGKTTVMAALLAMVPVAQRVRLTLTRGGWRDGHLERGIAGFLERCRERGLYSVEKVRAAWLAGRAGAGAHFS
jgi:hypothetical protein